PPLGNVELARRLDVSGQLDAHEHAVLAAQPPADPVAPVEQPGPAQRVLEPFGVLGPERLRGRGEQLRLPGQLPHRRTRDPQLLQPIILCHQTPRIPVSPCTSPAARANTMETRRLTGRSRYARPP